MKSFRTYLKEAEEGTKLKHITHPEDRPLMHGSTGFERTHAALTHAHEHIKSGKDSSTLTTKYDGSPAVVFGTHPQNGKFFVASKSAFNKDPKINYTPADVDKNHGHAPGLASKLKAALKHLPKVTPKGKVYQGDIMHSEGDVKYDKKTNKASFTPNTITYTASGEEAKKAAKAKVGVVVHTQYHGKDIQSMSAHHDVNHHEFKSNPDVHHHDASYDTKTVDYSKENQKQFAEHMAAAKALHTKHGAKMYKAIHPAHSGEGGHLATYINATVRNNTTPSVKGFKTHLEMYHGKQAGSVKTEKAQTVKREKGAQEISHLEKNKEHYNNLFAAHNHLAAAKNVLVKSLESGSSNYEHHIEDKESKPEGFVINHEHKGKTEPSKLVNRAEFARSNLLKVRK